MNPPRRARNNVVFLRISDEEKEHFQGLLNTTGLTITEYFRFHLLGLKKPFSKRPNQNTTAHRRGKWAKTS